MTLFSKIQDYRKQNKENRMKKQEEDLVMQEQDLQEQEKLAAYEQSISEKRAALQKRKEAISAAKKQNFESSKLGKMVNTAKAFMTEKKKTDTTPNGFISRNPLTEFSGNGSAFVNRQATQRQQQPRRNPLDGFGSGGFGSGGFGTELLTNEFGPKKKTKGKPATNNNWGQW